MEAITAQFTQTTHAFKKYETNNNLYRTCTKKPQMSQNLKKYTKVGTRRRIFPTSTKPFHQNWIKTNSGENLQQLMQLNGKFETQLKFSESDYQSS